MCIRDRNNQANAAKAAAALPALQLTDQSSDELLVQKNEP